MSTPSRAIILSRVSTDKQRDKGGGLEVQDADSLAYAAELGVPVVAHFRDAESGRTVSRAGLEAALRMLENNEADTLIIWDHTRLSRRLSDGLRLLDTLEEMGVAVFFSKTRERRGATPLDRFKDGIGFLYGEMEWETNLDRMRRGRTKKIEGGKLLGAGDAPYGYRFVGYGRERTLEVDEEQAEWVRRIFEWYDGGMGVREIRARLTALGAPLANRVAGSGRAAVPRRVKGEWSSATIYKILRRRAYIGEFEHNRWTEVKSKGGNRSTVKRPDSDVVLVPCPAILDRALWERVQDRLTAGRRNSRRNVKNEYLMGRRLRCGVCGGSYTGIKGGRFHKGKAHYANGNDRDQYGHIRRMYYRCGGSDKVNSVRNCDMPFIHYWKIDEAVWSWVERRLTNRAWVEEMLRAEQARSIVRQAEVQKELDWLTKEIADTEAIIGQLVLSQASQPRIAHIIQGQIDQQTDKLQRLCRDLEERQQQVSVTLSDEDIADVGSLVETLNRTLSKGWSFEEKRRLIDILDLTADVCRTPTGEVYLEVTSRLKFRDVVQLVSTPSGPWI